MACDHEQEWNELLEDCTKKAKIIKAENKKREKERQIKARQNEIIKYEKESQQMYSKMRKEIDADKAIKERIIGWMASDRTSLTYYKPVKEYSSYAMHTSYVPEEYVKKIFKTTTYGDKILLDLLREKFPRPIKVILCNRKVKIEWINKKN